jgi:hypothetical protein
MERGARVRWFLAKRRSVEVRGFRAGRLPSCGAPFGRDSILHASGGHLHMCHRGDRLAPSIGSSRRSGTEPQYRARQKDSHHASGMQAARTHRREEGSHRTGSGKELPFLDAEFATMAAPMLSFEPTTEAPGPRPLRIFREFSVDNGARCLEKSNDGHDRPIRRRSTVVSPDPRAMAARSVKPSGFHVRTHA